MADEKGQTGHRVGALVFQVSNHHAASCGAPPAVDGDVAGRYHGYFENEYGEQTVFVYDRSTREGTLWIGDNGWESPAHVVGGKAEDLVLGETEALWLKACWLAAIALQ